MGEVLGHWPWEFIQSPDRERYQAACARVLLEQRPQAIDLEVPHIGRWSVSMTPVDLREVRLVLTCQRVPVGVSALSQRQRELCRYMAAGYPVKSIASKMDLNRKTIDSYKHEVARRLGLTTTSLAAWCGSVRDWL